METQRLSKADMKRARDRERKATARARMDVAAAAAAREVDRLRKAAQRQAMDEASAAEAREKHRLQMAVRRQALDDAQAAAARERARLQMARQRQAESSQEKKHKERVLMATRQQRKTWEDEYNEEKQCKERVASMNELWGIADSPNNSIVADSESDVSDSYNDTVSDGDHVHGSIIRAAKRAGKTGSTTTVAALLDQGASPDTTDEGGATLLMISADNANIALTKLLLAAGANVNAVDDEGVTALMVAVDQACTDRTGNDRYILRRLTCINALLAAGANVHASDQCGWTALMYASQHSFDRAPFVRALLACAANVNSCTADGLSALIIASDQPHPWRTYSAVPYLLASGANVNATSQDGTTALMMAARRKFEPDVRLLLAAGANINAADDMGNTALLHCMCERAEPAVNDFRQRRHMVSCLLAAGADINAANKDGYTSLMFAARHEIELLPPLLSTKAAVTRYNQDLALGGEIHKSSCQELQPLLAATPDVNAITNDGSTALMLIAQQPWYIPYNIMWYGRASGVAHTRAPVIWKEDAEAAMSKATSATAEEAAAIAGKEVARSACTITEYYNKWSKEHSVKLLRDRWSNLHNLSIDARDKYKAAEERVWHASDSAKYAKYSLEKAISTVETRLGCAAKHSSRLRTQAIRDLLHSGAEVDARRADGSTALILATTADHEYTHNPPKQPDESIINALVAGGADVNAVNNDGWTPLSSAAFAGHAIDVQILLVSGADIDAVDDFGDTALHMAANEGHGAVVTTLLSAGASDKAINEVGARALHYAIDNGHGHVVTLLLKHGPLLLASA